MCTAVTIKDINNNYYLGRTMDFSYELEPSLYICPRNFSIKNYCSNLEINNKFAFIGIGQNISKLVFSEGTNEYGLSIAALYLPKYTFYNQMYYSFNQYSIDALDMVSFLLGNCKNITDIYSILQKINVLGIENPITNQVAPLHWIALDNEGKCVTIECRKNNIYILSNPIGVLANSPNFEWHMTNLNNYMSILPYQSKSINWDNIMLTPFGEGAGSFGLPGDFTSPSRFVRACFLKTHIAISKNTKECVINFFHLMELLSIPKGIVITKRNTYNYTQYVSFMNLTTHEYFFKTYNNTTVLYSKLPSTFASFKEVLEIGKLCEYTKFKNYL